MTVRKFDITRLTKEELSQREDGFLQQLAKGFSVEALVGKMVVQLMQCACEEQVGNQVIDPVLNRLCPHIKPVGFEQSLERFWST